MLTLIDRVKIYCEWKPECVQCLITHKNYAMSTNLVQAATIHMDRYISLAYHDQASKTRLFRITHIKSSGGKKGWIILSICSQASMRLAIH